jgi:hypothetical protein
VVTFGEEEHVVAHRRELPAAQGTGVRGGLEVLRAAELPPTGLLAGHVSEDVVVPGFGGTGQS